MAAGIFVLLAAWQAVVSSGRYAESLFPAPLTVAKGIVDLARSGALLEHFAVSMLRFAAGYSSAALLAIALGLLLGTVKWLWDAVDPIVQVLRPVSPLAWSPFIVLWFGIGNVPAIVIIFLAAFFPVLLSTVAGVRRVDASYMKLAQNLELTRVELLTKIMFPAAFPAIAGGLHIAVGTGWIFLVSGEMVGAQSGLGYLIVDSRNLLRLDLVLAGIVCIGLCGLGLDRLIRLMERKIERLWGVSRE